MRGAGVFSGQRSGLLPIRKVISLPGDMRAPGNTMYQLRSTGN